MRALTRGRQDNGCRVQIFFLVLPLYAVITMTASACYMFPNNYYCEGAFITSYLRIYTTPRVLTIKPNRCDV